MELVVFGVILPWLIVGLGCWLGFQLVQQNGRLLVRLESLEKLQGEMMARLAAGAQHESAPPAGLPVGLEAPEFELPDLSGNRRALSQFRGRRVLLTFFNPGCGFCTRMAPDLAALPADGADGRPVPLVVSTGDAGENRRLVEEHGIRCPVLLQEAMEVGSAYEVEGTPMGYLIDEEGRIASELAVGADALLELATAPPREEQAAGANEKNGHKGNRSLAESRIKRDGLRAGTPAPEFRLPRLDGGELSLDELRGRKVLLLFSDPHCGPCDELVPRLQQLARRTPEVQVVMVSRGDAEANRAKVKEHGLTFPVVLQRQWEISRRYGMFATPIAYLIDEEGVLAADVAVGLEAILFLFRHATAPANGNGKARRGKEVVPLRR